MSQYDWPSASKRRLVGKDINRVDGLAKASGKAIYTYDVRLPGMLYAKVVRCPHAHAKVKSIDTTTAEKMPGFKTSYVIQKPGTEIFWAGDDIVAVAAVDEHSAEMAARAVDVKYTILPFLVLDANPLPPIPLTAYRKPMDPQVVGDVKATTVCRLLPIAASNRMAAWSLGRKTLCRCISRPRRCRESAGSYLKPWSFLKTKFKF
jgi:xanthine dehydrogenase YagR molybdenum-binding subunit